MQVNFILYIIIDSMSKAQGDAKRAQQTEEYCYKTNTKNFRNSVPNRGGNWQRLKYDWGNYGKEVQQTTAPLEWVLDPNFVHRNNPCRPTDIGYNSKFGVSFDTTNPLVDTESELFNLTRPATRDPNYKYLPFCPNCGNKKTTCGEKECLEGYPCGGGVVSGCEQCQPKLFHFPNGGLKHEFTRISNPTCTLRETGINRFQPTYLDHQDRTRWENQGEIGINYRMVAKDNHVPCIPKPIDQSAGLPKAKNLPCKQIVPTCANPIEPLHNYYLASSTTCVPNSGKC